MMVLGVGSKRQRRCICQGRDELGDVECPVETATLEVVDKDIEAVVCEGNHRYHLRPMSSSGSRSRAERQIRDPSRGSS